MKHCLHSSCAVAKEASRASLPQLSWKGVPLEPDLTKMTLADQEEEQLQQLEEQWSDERNSDFADRDYCDNVMNESS